MYNYYIQTFYVICRKFPLGEELERHADGCDGEDREDGQEKVRLVAVMVGRTLG